MHTLRYLFFVYLLSLISPSIHAAPENCVALKGNGLWVTSHFSALARYVEYAGAPDGISGASSGAVSSFFYESISMSPLLKNTSEQEKNEMMALLLKSVPQSIADAIELVISDELSTLSEDPFYETLAQLLLSDKKTSFDASLAINALVTDMAILFENRASVESVFVIIDAIDDQGYFPGLGNLFIPEVRRYLIENHAQMKSMSLELNELNKSETMSFHRILAILPDELLSIYIKKIYTDIFENKYPLKFLPRLLNKSFVDSLILDKEKWTLDKKGVQDVIYFFLAFDNDFGQLLTNPSIISLDVVVELTSALNDFYAYGAKIDGNDKVVSNWRKLFNSQLGKSKAKSWYDLPKEWREEYKNNILLPSLKLFLKGPIPLQTKRDKDFIGDRLHVAIANGVLVDDQLFEDFSALQESLKAGDLDTNEKRTRTDEFINQHGKLINYFKIGYFTSKADALTIGSNISDQNDLKSRRYTNLGRASWRKAIVMSASEPGLGSIDTSFSYGYNGSKFISLGGWADLSPTQVLKSMECKTTSIIARIGVKSKLSSGMYKALGEEASKTNDVLDYLNASSSNAKSLSAADVIFCHNTQAYSPMDLIALAQDSYNPTEIVDKRLNSGSQSHYIGCGGSGFLP